VSLKPPEIKRRGLVAAHWLVAGSRLAFEAAGEHELKGVPDRWHLYRVMSEGA
jgi:hypothetical protein